MRRLLGVIQQQSGTSLTLLVVALPLLIGMLGIVIDTGMYGLAVVRLSSAADSASLAAASAIDLDLWRATRQLRIDLDSATHKAEAFAQVNYDGPVTAAVTINPERPNRVHVELSARFRTTFFKVMGVSEVTLKAQADGIVQ